MMQAEEVGHRLRISGLRARTITLKLRFSDYRTITRSITFPQATDSDQVIYEAARELFERHGEKPPWRLVGIRGSGLTAWEQLSLIRSRPKIVEGKDVDRVLDALRARFGRGVVYRARRLLYRN